MKFDPTKLSRDYYKYPVTRETGPARTDIEYLFSRRIYGIALASYLHTDIATVYYWVEKLGFEKEKYAEFREAVKRVDFSRLRRNYLESPMGLKEEPTKEEVEYLYNEVGFRDYQISILFGRGYSTGFARKYMGKYGIHRKDRSLIGKYMRETHKKQSGYEHHTKNPEFLKKMKKLYGVETTLNLPISRKHNLEVNRNPEILARAKEARRRYYQEHYGVDHNNQVHMSARAYEILHTKELFVEAYKNRSMKELAKELGVSDTAIRSALDRFGLEVHYLRESSNEREIRQCFPTIDFIKDHKTLHPYEIDLRVPNTGFGIEFNGNYWHSAKKKGKYYHKNKSLMAEKKGVFLFHIFEYEWYDDYLRPTMINNIKQMLDIDQTEVPLSDCTISSVPLAEAKEFFDKYHLKHARSGSSVTLGVYHKKSLLVCISFSALKNGRSELLQYQVRPGYKVKGALKALFSHYCIVYTPKFVMAMSDFGKEKDDGYKEMGFCFRKFAPIQSHWARWKYTADMSKMTCTEIKRTKNLKETTKIHKLHDCGQKVWYYKNK